MSRMLALALALFVVACQGPDAIATQPEASLGPFTDVRVRGASWTRRPPPPIIGGTIAVDPLGTVIVVADPDRDRLVRVAVNTLVRTEIPLWDGALPTRVAISDGTAPRAFVVLRGSGEIASIALTGAPDLTHRWVCPAPRGVTWDAARGLVRVACEAGELVSFDPSTNAGTSTIRLPVDDLRDVLVYGDHIIVTRFHSAELVSFDLEGHEQHRETPRNVENLFRAGGDRTGDFVAGVAWRAVLSGGEIVVSHQRAVSGVIDVSTPPPAEDIPSTGGAYGGGPSGVPEASCGTSVVQSAVSRFDAESLIPISTVTVVGGALPVDIAVQPDNFAAAVACAGVQHTDGSVSSVVPTLLGGDPHACSPTRFDIGSAAEQLPTPIAVAYLPDGRLVALGRDPSVLAISGATIPLGGESVFDVGHALFHTDAGHGVACASCHPEGGDDGRVWQFSDTGARRTLSLPPGLLSTAPFHWNGELASMDTLMHLVFTGRMGGGAIDAAHVGEVARWLDTHPTPAILTSDSEAAERGRALFEGSAACASCHSGEMLTNASTVDVGTGGAFQVPTLVGVSHRLPLMHTGCASTLRERFTRDCGGDAHGNQALTGAEIADLVVYLETL